MKISQELETIVQYAREEAMRTGSYAIGPEHLLLGILRHGDNSAARSLSLSGIDPASAKKAMEVRLFQEHSIPYRDIDSVRLSPESDTVLNLATAKAIAAGRSETLAIDLLRALAAGTGFCAGYLKGTDFYPAAGEAPEKKAGTVITEEQIQALLAGIKAENPICS